MIKALLIDIEGTVGDIAFVREVLFPYARARLLETLHRSWGDPAIVALVEDAAKAAHKSLLTPESAGEQFLTWMDEDRKITPLKTLQGLIWRDGYARGDLKAHLYDDVVPAFDVWHGRGMRLFIYSSGSIEAQKLYFAHSIAGDLTPKLSGYFDTTSGPKTEISSYAKIAREVNHPAPSILFLSDAPGEIVAARGAGLRACRIERSRDPDFVERNEEVTVAGSLGPLVAAFG